MVSALDMLQSRQWALRPLQPLTPTVCRSMRDLDRVLRDSPSLAYDRAPRSVRHYSVDGHLRISDARISKSEVSSYLGRELVNSLPAGVNLTLDPLKEYAVLRPAAELDKAASTFIGVPLLWQHKPLDSNHHPSDITCGAVTDAWFDAPWLHGSLVCWVQTVIDAINDGINALSAAYHFDAIPETGTFTGKPYQFRMAGIVANHVAVVDTPRVKGAQIGDSLPLQLRR